MEQLAYDYFAKIDELGGMVEAVRQGFPQREIAEASYRLQQEIGSGKQTVVGINAPRPTFPGGCGASCRSTPARYEYLLTEAGRELYPVILTLMRWGDKHLADDVGPPLVLEHACGHRLVAKVVCEACGEPAEARTARPVARDRAPLG
jgi:hypothetical protein